MSVGARLALRELAPTLTPLPPNGKPGHFIAHREFQEVIPFRLPQYRLNVVCHGNHELAQLGAVTIGGLPIGDEVPPGQPSDYGISAEITWGKNWQLVNRGTDAAPLWTHRCRCPRCRLEWDRVEDDLLLVAYQLMLLGVTALDINKD
jgi:hypothetical protein